MTIGTLDLASAVEAGIAEFEKRTRRRMLASATHGQDRGSMYGGAQAFHVLHYAFDLASLHLRLDPAWRRLPAAGRASPSAVTARAVGWRLR